MHRTSGMKSVLYLYIAFTVLLVSAVLAVAFYMTHIMTITRPDGELSRSDWPKQYANSFDDYLGVVDGVPEISAKGISSIEKNQLWVQILDEQGTQVMAHNKPSEIQSHYPISELLKISESAQLNEYTVSVISFSNNEQLFECIIGFPIGITKKTMYFNSDRFTNSKSVLFWTLVGLIVVIIIACLIYGIWFTKHLLKLVKLSGEIAARTYLPKRIRGVFGDAYKSFNVLNAEIRKSDEIRIATGRMQEEWVSNITHDLKTPLSPIKGYAELLSDPTKSVTVESRVQYGRTILRNTEYAEKLVDDLKLTYQLKNNKFPINKKESSLTLFLKELVIDIRNHSNYSERELNFVEANEEVVFSFDDMLLKRAINNLIYNALIHNDTHTKVDVSLWIDDRITIIISDNGQGIDTEKIDRIFERYYQGASTNSGAGGTGLGMAISKQIVEIHEGRISVKSELGKGTRIIIDFPITTHR